MREVLVGSFDIIDQTPNRYQQKNTQHQWREEPASISKHIGEHQRDRGNNRNA